MMDTPIPPNWQGSDNDAKVIRLQDGVIAWDSDEKPSGDAYDAWVEGKRNAKDL